jgi:hypothetical protein
VLPRVTWGAVGAASTALEPPAQATRWVVCILWASGSRPTRLFHSGIFQLQLGEGQANGQVAGRPLDRHPWIWRTKVMRVLSGDHAAEPSTPR